MDTVTLQVPINKSIRDRAAIVAEEEGFSSLQEVVRVLVNKFAKRHLVLNAREPDVKLSAKNEKRYLKMLADFKAGRNIKTAHSLEKFFAQLEA